MIYHIKIKSGFFKTMQYNLEIRNEQIMLTQKNGGELDRIVIAGRDLIVMCLLRRNNGIVELELKTRSAIYIGSLAPETNVQELAWTLTKEFGRKVNVMDGVIGVL